MFAVCKDHLELAIDMFVDEYGEAPDIIELQEAQLRYPAWAPPTHCVRCEQVPIILVCPCGG